MPMDSKPSNTDESDKNHVKRDDYKTKRNHQGNHDTDSDLQLFRDEWKRELSSQNTDDSNLPSTSGLAHNDNSLSDCSVEETTPQAHELVGYSESPFPFQFTDSLLRSWQETPPTKGKRKLSLASTPTTTQSDGGQACNKKTRTSLVDVFINDLNELDDVPFFDVSLPREIAVKIFGFLEMKDLCSCSQVSKAWNTIANDSVIWEKVYHILQSTFTGHSKVTDSTDWKLTVKDCYIKTKTLLTNWKEHKCHTTYYHHARGGILTAVHSLDNLVAAGYTNGQIRTWDVLTHTSQTYESSNKSLVLVNEDEDDLGTSENSVTCLKLGLNDQLIAGYKHGQVQTWSQLDPECMAVYDFPDYSVEEVISRENLFYVFIKHRQDRSCFIKVLNQTERGISVADSVSLREMDETWTLPKIVMAPLTSTAILYLTRDSFNIHKSSKEAYHPSRHSVTQIEEFYATHFTYLESSTRCINLGFTSHLGLQAEYKVRLYDPDSLKMLSDLRGHTSQVTCIDSSFPSGSLLVTGCHDRRVRLYDTRLPAAAVHTYMGHPMSVTCIQSDDWKIISGDEEGYICVWDQRMGAKFWESQSRHPVKYLKFTCNHLVSANIPVQSPEEQFDYDRMTHLRYRGRLQVSDFRIDQSNTSLPSICSSSYDMPDASNYNLSLITPYDVI